MALQKAMVSSKNNKWETPWRFFRELDKEFHFTLDPCAEDSTAKCDNYYTEETNGLDKDWSKDVVFMNPPYGGNTRAWIEKALQESRKGAKVICLIVSSSDRSYWHDFIFPYGAEIRFIRGRIKFGDSKFTAPFASAIVIFDGEREGECEIVYYNKSINKRWGEEDKQEKEKMNLHEPESLICDLCKKDLPEPKVVEHEGRTFVVCISCKNKGEYPAAPIKVKPKKISYKSSNTQFREERKRFREKQGRIKDKQYIKKKQMIEIATRTKSKSMF